MPDKVVITPAEGKIVFNNAAGTEIGSIDTTDDGLSKKVIKYGKRNTIKKRK